MHFFTCIYNIIFDFIELVDCIIQRILYDFIKTKKDTRGKRPISIPVSQSAYIIIPNVDAIHADTRVSRRKPIFKFI